MPAARARPVARQPGRSAKGRQRDEAAVRQFVETLSRTMADQGFPRMPARVLLTLTSADDAALTAAEIGQRLDVSPAAVSGAVRFLVHLGLLVRQPVAGERRDRYRVPQDAWYAALLTDTGWLRSATALAADGVAALGGPGTPAGRRVAEMRDFYAFAEQETAALLTRWLAARSPGR